MIHCELRKDGGGALRVLILNQFFYPDVSATSQLMTDLAGDLAAQGVEVTALCSNSSYVGNRPLANSEMRGGVRIERVSVIGFSRQNIMRRLGSYLSFYVSAFFRVLRLPRQDVILVLTTPPLIALVAYLVRVLRGSRMAYLVQDVYPEIAFEFGLLKPGSIFGRLLSGIATFLLKKADIVIALGTCMQARLLAKGLDNRKIHVIPNWADGAEVRPIPRAENPFRTAHGLEDSFIVLYSGNMGRAHDFSVILQGMEALAKEKDVVFVFVGRGPKRDEIVAFTESHPEVNVRLLDYVPREDLKLSMGAADISILAVADGLEGLVVPSKLYGIMASGRPALYVGPANSEAAHTIVAHGCGIVVSNSDVAGFCRAILEARGDPAKAEAMGVAGRAAFEQRFDRRVATQHYYELLTRLVKAS
ncbi:MAG TPA: glycosyltransferase family 4 protein [Terriglobales bacterium]|nr:glycosyltransferase family 4 protein [Terriglobales bacterium]